jgi:hypothetical protein
MSKSKSPPAMKNEDEIADGEIVLAEPPQDDHPPAPHQLGAGTSVESLQAVIPPHRGIHLPKPRNCCDN